MGIFNKIFMGVTYCNTHSCDNSSFSLAAAGSCLSSKFSAFSVFSAFLPFLARLIHLVCFIQYAFHASARRIIKSVISIMVVAAVCVGSCPGDTWGDGTLDGQPVDFEMGDAIYRTLFVIEHHAGIYYKYAKYTQDGASHIGHLVLQQGKRPTPNKDGRIVEAPSLATWDEFLGKKNPIFAGNYVGNYTVPELKSNVQNCYQNRWKVIDTATRIIDEAIPDYQGSTGSWGVIDYWPSIAYKSGAGTPGNPATITDIVKIRCDGFVEYCYEANGFMVWKRYAENPERASILEYPEDHVSKYAADPNKFSPTTQKSDENSRMRPATGTPPAIQRLTFSPINGMKSIRRDDAMTCTTYYANTRTFTIITSATDSESGVKEDSYQFWIQQIGDTFLKKYGDIPNPRLNDVIPQVWGTITNLSGSSVATVTVSKDGVYLLRISVCDNANNNRDNYFCSPCIQIDTQSPAPPTISSPTHPDSNKPSMTNNVTFQWTDSPDVSGIADYSYDMDNSPTTIPDEVVDFDWVSCSFSNLHLTDGTWYFHLRARDNAGNWSPASHYQVQINKGSSTYSQRLKVNDADVLTLSCERGASYTLTCNSSTPNGRVKFYSYYDRGMIGSLDSGDEIVSSLFIDDNSHVDEDAASSKIQITQLIPEGYTGTLTIQAIDEITNSAAFCTLGSSQRVLPQFISGRVSGIISQKVNGVIIAEGIESDEWVQTPIDSNGEYRLYLPPGRYDVYAEVTGIPSDSNKKKEIVLTANNPITNVDFEVVTTGGLSSITGRVIDDTGKGVPGAYVDGYSFDNGFSDTWAYTDMDGYYVIYVKPGKKYTISVDAFGYTRQVKYEIAAGSKNADFTLTPCKATISGTVTDANGNGVLGAEIKDVATNRFGHYCLYVPEGSTNYFVGYARGIDSAWSCKTANAMDTNVNFQLLYHNSTISGKVYEPDGITPIRGAHVSGSYWTYTDTVSDDVEAYTNPDGSYELRVLEGYKYSVSAEKHGYYRPSSKDVPAPNAAIDFIMPGKMPGMVTGIVRDTMGSPIMGALIEVMKDNIPTATATSNEYGSYTITNLSEGAYTLCVSRGGYESAATTVTVKADETSSNDFIMDKTNLFYVDDDFKQYYANGSIKYPYYCIQQATDDCCLSSDGTVSVAAGTYNESVHINKKIALIGAGAAQTTITAAWFINTNTVTFDGTAGKAMISGFKITGATGDSFSGGNGIYCCSSSSPIITNNTISGNNNSGICCALSSSPLIINNTISGNNDSGIYCYWLFPASPNIYNNIITENGTTSTSNYGICNSGGSIDYNCIWGNGYGSNNNYDGCSAGLHDISANPRFIGEGNYHLQTNSPCINRGTNTIRDLPETDSDDNPRIRQIIVDMGAYESFYPATITGNISYSGTKTGSLYCWITDNPDGKGNPIAYSNIISVSNSGTFKYEISIQNPGTYYLTCLLDADGNDSFGLGDVVGIYGSLSCVYLNDTTPVFVGNFTPINIRAGDIIPNIDVSLRCKISPLYFKVVTQHNNTETAGKDFGVTLIVTDYDGNPTGTPTDTLNISCSWNATSSPNKFLPIKPSDGNIIFTAGNAFLGTFTLVNAGEKPCITVRSGLISGTSSPITVNASSPTTLLFSAPGTVTAGNTFLLGTITVCDLFGNTATSYMGNKLLTYSGPANSPTNIAPSYTNPVNFEQGISTILIQTTLTKAETVQIHITDGSIGGTATIVVTQGIATVLTIEPATWTITSGATISCTATARDTAGNTWTVTIAATFSSNDPGGTFTGSIYTAGKAGTWTVTGKYMGVFGTATVVVTHGMAIGLMIEPATYTITSGATVNCIATAQDTAGNTWTVTTDTIFNSDDPWSTVSGSIYAAGKAGTRTITGKYMGVSGTAMVVVTHGTATALTIEPATCTITSGSMVSCIATARDTAGNTWTVTADTIFSSDDPWSTVSGSIYAAGKAGTRTITGKYMGLSGTATVVVTHGTATALTIELATCTIPSGAMVNYIATAHDAADNTWIVTTATIFNSDDPWGMVLGSMYTAGKAGTWTITGKHVGVSGTATVIVIHGTATALTIEPATCTITSGAMVNYTATAHDIAGNTWTVTTAATFSSNDSWGTFTGSIYAADKAGTWTITGKYAGLSGTATVMVTHGMATGLMIELALGTVTSGATVSCTATAHDTAGNTWTVTTDSIFNSADPWGMVSGSIYTAGKAGTWTITNKYAGLVGSATIVVIPGTASRFAIEAASTKWFKDEPGTITISVHDRNGNLIATTTTFQLEPAGMITSNKATIINGMTVVTVKISMVGPVVIIASKDYEKNVYGSISLNLLMRKDQQTVGTFTTGNGLETKVVVPENTLPTDYYVIIGTPTTEMHKEIGVAHNRLLASQKIIPDTMREFNLKDESGTITLPESSRVTITIPYTDFGSESIKIGQDRVREDTLRIYRLVYGKWEMVDGEQIQDSVRNCVSAQVNAFSVFALIGETYSADFSQLMVFPNPFKPMVDKVVNFSGLSDSTTINIYNLTGELAWEKQGIVGGSVTWDGKNNDDEPVSSGTYIYVIRDANGNKKTGKVAVIW